jgi:hypothetical protein
MCTVKLSILEVKNVMIKSVLSLIILFTFSLPVVKATGLSFSVVHRSYYILVLNNKKFMFFCTVFILQ